MSLVTAVKEETNLAGVLKSQLSPTGTSFTALFYDTKLGTQRTPQSTTLTFMINKDGTKAERIRLSSHTTDVTTGITTCTVATNGRALPLFGTGSGSSTGNQHEPGDPIGCVTNHEPTAQLNSWMQGSAGSGANALRTGDETDSNIYYYAQNADGSKPFIAYIAASNAWAYSNDGVSSTLIGNGASTYTGGDGISLTSSDFDIDLTDTVIFVSTSSGAGDSGKVARLNGSGKFDTGFITAAPLATYISDVSVSAADINTVVNEFFGAFQFTATTLEAINGSATPQFVSYGSSSMKDVIKIYDSDGELKVTVGTNRNIGNADATTRISQGFAYTDAFAASIAINDITFFVRKQAAPADNLFIEIQTDSGSNTPSGTVVTNGTSATVAGGSLTNGAYEAYKFTFATPPSITSGTTYHAVLKRSGGNDAVNYYQVLDANGNTYSGGVANIYQASTTTWSSIANDIKMQMVLNVSYGGKICKCDADNVLRSNGVGFITSNVGSGASGSVQYARHVTYSGLTDGATYVASTTAGGLTIDSSTPTTATAIDSGSVTPHVVAGRAINGKIQVGTYKRLVIVGDKVAVHSAVDNKSIDLLVPVGFRPDRVMLQFSYMDASAGPATHIVQREYNGTVQVGGLIQTATGTVLSHGIDTSTPFAGACTLQAIYDNAVLIRLTLDVAADSVDLQRMEFTKN